MNGYVLEGDCLDILKQMVKQEVLVQAVVCDPPYGISFMGRYWDQKDNIAFQSEVWRLCFDLLPPGGHLVAFGGTRTYHRLVCAVEDSGFEIRDQLAWVYGTGFPKSMDVAKAIDKAARGVPQAGQAGADLPSPNQEHGEAVERELVAEARPWIGYGTALKPAWEPIVLARKPLADTVAANVVQYGTGALNIDACRIETTESLNGGAYAKSGNRKSMHGDERMGTALGMFQAGKTAERDFIQPNGRFPANFVHDGSPEVLEKFSSSSEKPREADSPSRFFYCAKASKKERGESQHPTVKPRALMQWLVRLVTPPGGMVLDPFAGTGTTGEAAHLEGFQYVLIEREPEYVYDIEHRLSKYGPVNA